MAVTLLSSAARTASGSFQVTVPTSAARSAVLLLDVTAAASAATDTLDVYLQSSVDSVTWDDFAHFTQVLGNGGPVKHLAVWNSDVSPESEMHAPQDAAVPVGVIQGPIGDLWRVKWVIAGATADFTFSVSGRLILS